MNPTHHGGGGGGGLGGIPGMGGMGGMGGALNLQQIGAGLGIFAFLDRFFGGNPYLSAGFGILVVTTLYLHLNMIFDECNDEITP